jgi:hypothetical protein
MSDERPIILTTAVPKFTDGGDFMLCELESNGRKWVFGISWGHTELAMPACAGAIEAHRERARNVVEFERQRCPLPRHG